MNEHTCAECFHFEPADNGANGECHRFPPSVFPVPSAVAPHRMGSMSIFPTVRPEQTCGEWEPSDLFADRSEVS